MRNAFADEIGRLGDQDRRVVLLSGDIGNRLFDRFKDRHPTRFYNCGVAEANMMGVAAGLGLSGLRPVIYTIAPFTTTRCYEQIRVDVCYQHSPVIIVGTGAGLAYAELGPTHHSCEDIAILRVLPGMRVVCPCDSTELRLALRTALCQPDPVYLRIGKKGEPAVHCGEPAFEIGKAITVRPGRDMCFVSTGTIMPVVLAAAERLAAADIGARVESFHTVKPLDTARLGELFARYPLVVSVEEHGLAGGLGSAIAEWLATQSDRGGRLLALGTGDVFLHETGSQDYARSRFGLTVDDIVATVRHRLALS